MAQDMLLFARQFLASPSQVSAISPSSRYLARAMAAGLGPHTGKVIEFGPGTGQLTRGILAAGVAPHDLTLIEMSADFAQLLSERFNDVQVCRAPAQEVVRFAPKGSVGAVVSGLPLLSMPDAVVEAILRATFTVLRKGGEMRQFTYGAKSPISPLVLQKLGLTAVLLQKVWPNLPPARVFAIKRAGEV